MVHFIMDFVICHCFWIWELLLVIYSVAFYHWFLFLIQTLLFALWLQLAIPIVPTIRVLITFTKFEELQPAEEFSTPLSSPVHFEDAKSKESSGSTSWISWMRGSHGAQSSDSESRSFRDEVDPFHIPTDYAWVDATEKKRRMKAKKAKNKKHRRQAAAKSGDGKRPTSEDPEE